MVWTGRFNRHRCWRLWITIERKLTTAGIRMPTHLPATSLTTLVFPIPLVQTGAAAEIDLAVHGRLKRERLSPHMLTAAAHLHLMTRTGCPVTASGNSD